MLNFIILILATYKLSHLIAKEDGPFDILDKFRELTGVKTSEYGELYGTNEFSKGLICMNCNSVWIAFLIVAFYIVNPITSMVMMPFAISGVITFINNNYI